MIPAAVKYLAILYNIYKIKAIVSGFLILYAHIKKFYGTNTFYKPIYEKDIIMYAYRVNETDFYDFLCRKS